MRIKRPALFLGSLALVLAASNIVNGDLNTETFVENYPTVVCPPNLSGLSSAISVPSSKSKFRSVGAGQVAFRSFGTYRYVPAQSPVIIDAGAVTPILWQTSSGAWGGATTCNEPSTSQWFVGGTSDVTSSGQLIMVNGGLSTATADISIWSENGVQAEKVLTVKANSFITVALNSLATGASAIVVHVLARAGQISTFMLDTRSRGLKGLGGDLVNSVGAAATDVFIPAIPQQRSGNKVLTHTLRVLVPGDADARISVDLVSPDGSFIPLGLDSVQISRGRVVSIPLAPNISSAVFGLHIRSDQPLVAGVYSPTSSLGKSDFVWSTGSPELGVFSIAVTGISPTLVFNGDQINLTLDVISEKGESKTIRIKGSDIAIYRVPSNTRTVSFTSVSKGVHGAGLVATTSGYGFFPIVQGSALTRAAIPSSNIRVLNP